MERWSGKIAIVTGASSGIGWCISKDLLKAGMIVVGLARSIKEEKLRESLNIEYRSMFYAYKCDVSSLESIKIAFSWVKSKFNRIHVLINNAGSAKLTKLLDENNEEILQNCIDVNLMGTIYCTKEAFKLMKLATADGEECHIININSLLGHQVPIHIPAVGLNLYPVAKHAVRATNEVLRRELFEHKLIRLSNMSPGLTSTNFDVNFLKDVDTKAPFHSLEKILTPEDVSSSVVFILSTPLHVTVAELVMVPSIERY